MRLTMDRILAIENEIKKLSPEERTVLRRWFVDFDAEEWDRQMDADVDAGKLDSLAQKALKAFEEGKCTPI